MLAFDLFVCVLFWCCFHDLKKLFIYVFLCCDSIAFEKIEEIRVKGKDHLIPVYSPSKIKEADIDLAKMVCPN
jgi:hypothetical protein